MSARGGAEMYHRLAFQSASFPEHRMEGVGGGCRGAMNNKGFGPLVIDVVY